jgi:hypothetical protein
MSLKSPQHKAWLAFVVLFVVEIAFLLGDIFGRHMVAHDTIQGFFNQYYHLNGIVQYGQVPLWTPFMTQGAPMAWWYALQGGPGFLFDIFALLGGGLKHFDFFALFHLGLFFNQAVLFLGVWLLSGRYFASVSTRVFVMLCVASSFVFYAQAHFLLLIYIIPMVLWFMHRFFDTAKWRWLFAAGYIYLVHLLTCNAGLIPLSTLLVAAYFFFDICNHREHYLRWFRSLAFGRGFWACAAGIAFMAVAVAVYLRLAQDPWTVNANSFREPDGGVSVSTFLAYAGNTHLNKWYELIFRSTPILDFTLYMGMFALPCVIAGIIFSRRREMRVWLGWTAVMFLLSIGSVLAVALYYFWPPMHFYRHLTLISPVVKFGLCFLAGFGFEALFVSGEGRDRHASWGRNMFWIGMAVVFAGAGKFMLSLIKDTPVREWIVRNMLTDGLPLFGQEMLQIDLRPAMIAAFILAALCAMMVFIRSPRALLAAGWVWVALQALDIYDYRVVQMRLRSIKISEDCLKTMKWEPLPWRPRRDPATWTDDGRTELLKTKFGGQTVHGMFGNFTFRDLLTTPYFTTNWQKSLDNYLRAYIGVPFNAPGNINVQTPNKLEFTLGIPAALKISGVTEDKVQVFTSAYYFSSPEKVAALMVTRDYAGDVLLLSSYQGRPFADRKDDPVDAQKLASDGRADVPYKMVLYAPNEVVIETTAPADRSSWLLYSDMWHPSWRAEVNGKPVPVYAANLAYKAVPLVPGDNKVRFYFHAPLLVFMHWFFAWNALAVIGVIGWGVGCSLREPARCVTDEPSV